MHRRFPPMRLKLRHSSNAGEYVQRAGGVKERLPVLWRMPFPLLCPRQLELWISSGE